MAETSNVGLPEKFPAMMANKAAPIMPPAQAKSKDGLIKMMLQSSTAATAGTTATTPSTTSTSTPTTSSKSRWSDTALPSPRELAAKMPPIDIVEENTSLFVHQISSKEKVHGLIGVDHPYARPFNWRPDYSVTSKPTKTLFMNRLPRNPNSHFYATEFNVSSSIRFFLEFRVSI